MDDEFDVTGNIKTIEWLKTELLGTVSSLYRILLKGSKAGQEALVECFAGVLILTYLLAKRLGIEFSTVDLKVQDKLKIGILEEDEIEKTNGDLSKLLAYFKQRKQC